MDFFVHNLSHSQNVMLNVSLLAKYSLVSLEMMAICKIDKDHERVSDTLPGAMREFDQRLLKILLEAESEDVKIAKDLWTGFVKKIHQEKTFANTSAVLPKNSPLMADSSMPGGGVASGSAAGDQPPAGGKRKGGG